MSALVLLTRPAGRNGVLAEHLRAAGLEVCEAPALAIQNLPTPRPPPVPGSLYLFVSRQAVSAYFDVFQGSWPPDAWAAAVGGATAHALSAHVPRGRVLSPDAVGAADSEALLAVIDARVPELREAHVLRAQQGRDWMADQLRARGWTVQCHALYERRPLLLESRACERLARDPGCVLLVTSLEALEAIAASLRHWGLAWPDRLSVVTLHERMARRLQCWYARRPVNALRLTVSAPDDAALFHAIVAACGLFHWKDPLLP